MVPLFKRRIMLLGMGLNPPQRPILSQYIVGKCSAGARGKTLSPLVRYEGTHLPLASWIAATFSLITKSTLMLLVV